MPHEITIEQKLRDNLALLLKNCGTPARCRGCDREIWFIRHTNGRNTPYTADGLNHFIDCPAAARFKGGARG